MMTPLGRARSVVGTERSATRGLERNYRLLRGIEEARARKQKSFKTNPIVPSFPNGAARCAFARSGAQRAPDAKSEECRIFSRGEPVR